MTTKKKKNVTEVRNIKFCPHAYGWNEKCGSNEDETMWGGSLLTMEILVLNAVSFSWKWMNQPLIGLLTAYPFRKMLPFHDITHVLNYKGVVLFKWRARPGIGCAEENSRTESYSKKIN